MPTRIDYLAPEFLRSDDHDVTKQPSPHKDHPPSRTGYAFWEVLILSAILTFVALTLFAQTPTPVPTPRPQCSQQGWYRRTCDLSWVFANPGMAGHIIPNGCAAHTQMIYGANGAQYALIDQCPQGCVGTQGLYKKPDDSVALPQWQFFYTDPDALQHRTQFGYIGPGVPPPGFQTYQFVTLANVPDPPRATLMNAYGCSSGTPTPVPSPTRTPTPAPNIYAAWIEAAYNQGYMSACGPSLFCPGDSVQISTGYVSRAQEAVFLMKSVHGPGYLPPACVGLFLDVVCR